MSKNLKKMLTACLSAAVLLSMSVSALAVPSYSISHEGENGLVPVKEVLFSESFEGNDTTGSVLGAGSKTPLSVNSRQSSSTDGTMKFLWVNNVGSVATVPYYSLKSADSLKGEYSIEFKFNKTQKHTVNAGTSKEAKTDVMFFGAGYTDGSNESLAIKLGIDENDKPYYIDKTGAKKLFLNDTDHAWTAGFELYKFWKWDEGDWLGKTISRATAEQKKEIENLAKTTADWYVIKVNVDTDSKTYRVYLNGALVVKDEEFIGAEDIDWSTTGLNIPYALGYDCNIGVRYVYDDMRIYREPYGYENIYANNFDFYPDGTTWIGNTAEANLTGVAELGLSVFGGKGSVVKASGGKLVTDENGKGAVMNALVADDSIVIEGDVLIPEFTAEEENIYAPIIAVAGASNGGGIRIGVNKDGEVISSWYHELSGLTKYSTITLGETHRFLLYIDFKLLKADFYVDGKLVAEDISMGRNANTASGIKNGNGIAIGLGYHKETPPVTVSYDNIRIYKDERIEVFSKLASIVPDSVEKGTILPCSVEGADDYTVTWSSDDVEIENNVVNLKRSDANKLAGLKATVTDINGEYSLTNTYMVRTPQIVWEDEEGIYQKSYLSIDEAECENPADAVKVAATVAEGYDYIPVLAKFVNNKLVSIDIGTDSKTVEIEKNDGWGDVKFMLFESAGSLNPVTEAEDICLDGVVVTPYAENVVLAGAFSDSMVLQRDEDIKVWGYAGDDDYTKVNVSLGENTAVAYVKDGMWEAVLPSMEATTEPQTLTVKGENYLVTVNDILIGDVYFVGGQSNSEYRVDRTDTYQADKASFTEEDNIRILYQTANKKESVQLDPPVGTKWEPLTASTMAKFSAIGCYFAKTIKDNGVDVPIGLIQTSLGGTWLHEHTPLSIADKYDFSKKTGARAQVYNVLGAPVERFSAKGLIWYQGENESIASIVGESTAVYKDMFSDYVSHLKEVTGCDLKVFMVQLSSHTNKSLLNWNVPRMRAFQYDMACNFDHEIYMVPSLDQGVKEADLEGVTDIKLIQSIVAHPKYKKALGERMANIALATIYGGENEDVFALEYEDIKYNGDSVTIKFKNAGSGLSLQEGTGEELLGFELTKDGKAYPATATITENDTVTLTGVTDATGVRYAFYMSAPKTAANLINGAGIPCPTFAAGVDAIKIDALSQGLME